MERKENSSSNNKALVRVIEWLIYAVAFVPLIVFSQYLSPFHFGKVIVFRTIVEIMAVLYVVLIMRDWSYRPRTNKIFWGFLAFTLAFSLTTLTSYEPYTSFWGTLERMGGVWTFWHYFVLFVILTAVFRSEKEWKRLFDFVILSGVLSALYGFGQRTTIQFFVGSGDRERIFGTIGNPALFAGYELLAFFMSIIFFLKETNQRWRIWYASAGILMGIAILMTAVRGSLLAMGVGLIIFAFLWYRVHTTVWAKRIFFGLVGAAVLFAVIAFSLRNTSFIKNSAYLNRITDFSVNATTVQTRFWAWEAGINGWNDSARTILVGYGPENFDIPFSKHFNPKFYDGSGAETLFDRAHNMFIEVLVTMGIVGFAAYVWLFVVIFQTIMAIGRRAGEYTRLYAIGFTSLIIAYMIHNTFIFDTSANFITIFTILGLIAFLEFQHQPIPEQTKTKFSSFAPAVGVILAIGALFLIYQTNIRAAIANYTTTRAMVADAQSDFSGAVADYTKALAYNVAGKYEIRNDYAQFLANDNAADSQDPAYAGAVQLGIQYETKSVAETPHEYLPMLYLSHLYLIAANNDATSPDLDSALKYSQLALTVSPTFIRTFLEIGEDYLAKDDYTSAEATFKQAVALDPGVGVLEWYASVASLEAGDNAGGQALLQQAITDGYAFTETDYQRLAGYYGQTNDFKNLEWVYEGLIKVAPDNPQYHATLAVIYQKLGRIDDAVTQARAAAAADPDFEPQAKAFVESLGRTW